MNNCIMMLAPIAGILLSITSVTTTPISSGLGTFNTAVSAATPGDVIELLTGEFQVTGSATGILLNNPISVLGAQHGKDARGRSPTGFGNASYTGLADPNESTITCTTCYRVIKITSSQVVLDGLSVTCSYTGTSNVNGIWIYGSPSLSDITVINCVIRHLAHSDSNAEILGINAFISFHRIEISYSEIRDFKTTAYVWGIYLDGTGSSS